MQGAPYQPPINVYVRGDDMAELQRVNDELLTQPETGARRRGRRQLARDREAGDGGRASTAISPPTSASRGQRRRAAARHGRRHRADASCATATPARHPRAARAGVPQRFRGRSPGRPSIRRRARSSARPTSSAWSRASDRAASSASSDAGRRRSASISPVARSATSRPTSRQVAASDRRCRPTSSRASPETSS